MGKHFESSPPKTFTNSDILIGFSIEESLYVVIRFNESIRCVALRSSPISGRQV